MKVGKRISTLNPNAPFNVWVGNEANADDRLKLAVSADDRRLIDSIDHDSREHVVVTDVRTGKRYELQRISCGLKCRCALGLVAEVLS